MAHTENLKTSWFEIRLTEPDDLLASQVSWNSANRKSVFFRTQSLLIRNGKAEIRPSRKASFAGYLIFVAAMSALIVGIPYSLFNGHFFGSFFLAIWGCVFGNIGYQVIQGSDSVKFDKSGNSYSINGQKSTGQIGRLEEIYAIQLLRGGRSSPLYEMNLVFHNGERANVLGSNEYVEIQSFCLDLAVFLNVPIWKNC